MSGNMRIGRAGSLLSCASPLLLVRALSGVPGGHVLAVLPPTPGEGRLLQGDLQTLQKTAALRVL